MPNPGLTMANSHPFARVFNKVTLETKKFLFCLAIDVYYDSLVETSSARSWPSRSLSF